MIDFQLVVQHRAAGVLTSTNFNLDALGVITLLYKPDSKYNYCSTPNIERYNAVDCLGGDWFYGFFFAAEMEGATLAKPLKRASDSVNLHINTFCVNCHAPAFKTDYVRTLNNIRNPFKMESKLSYCAPFQADFVPKMNKITTASPSNLPQFRANIKKYLADSNLSPNLPGDVPEDPTIVFNEMGSDTVQSMFDSYAWKSFIAICWPNKAHFSEDDWQRGDPDTKAPFNNNINSSMALIYDEGTKSCRTAQMAPVGLHIARKTYYAPQWIWMTFEHKDNVPDANVTPEDAKGIFYSANRATIADSLDCSQWPLLYPDKAAANCPNVDLNRFVDDLKMAPNQLTRLVPIDPVAQKFNAVFQAELKKIESPFANYVLVNTQWALNGRQQNSK
jgi:hypothetical protein